jgi:transcriptional regulator with XRE-family HTH domain
VKINQKSAIPPGLEKPLKEMGAGLARLRIARHLPQRIAAERAGVSRNTLSRIENGDPSVAVGQVLRYFAVVGKSNAFIDALNTEADAAVRGLALREKTKRARTLSASELKRYDF